MNAKPDPLTCAEVRELASAWLDGELADGRELAEHRARCRACDEYANDLAATRAGFAALAAAPAPEAWPAIEARARASRRPAPTSRALPRAIPQVLRFAAALVGGASVIALQWSTERERAPSDEALRHALEGLAGIDGPPAELQRVSVAPERQLLLALNPLEEDDR